VELYSVPAETQSGLEAASKALAEIRAEGLVISTNPLFNSTSGLLAELALRRRIPAIFQYHEFAAAGGLMSYGGSLNEQMRLAGVYVGRILNGERPFDLPVQQTTKFELILNMKTAKVLGLTVPITLLGRADDVVE
jgi:putative ABC transport system substrate-binding protein